jgi:peroxiredoxin
MLAGFRTAFGLVTLVVSATQLPSQTAEKAGKPARPSVGDLARDFELSSIDDKKVKLSTLTRNGPVVLIVLRGYPGYQCPICNRQVGDLLSNAKEFKDAKTNVVLVYPGPSDELKKRAEEFVRGKSLPEHFHLLLDPDYRFTAAYDLRWQAPGETAYPSAFVISTDGKVRFAKVSQSHGDRASTEDLLKALGTKNE